MAIQLGTAAVGAGMTYLQGKQMEKSAMDKINQFKWKELQNPYKTLQVSTLGADLQREEAARAGATGIQALRGAEARGIIGGTGDVVQGTNKLNREAAADLDMQQKAIDMAAAGDDTRLRDMEEKRQTDELEGYSNLMNTGMGMKYQGIGDVVKGIGAASTSYAANNAEGMFGEAPEGSTPEQIAEFKKNKRMAYLGFGKANPYSQRNNPNDFSEAGMKH